MAELSDGPCSGDHDESNEYSDPLEIAVNAGARLSTPAKADVSRTRKLIAQAKACINPGFRFYQQKFSVQFHDTVRAFKAARLCCPIQVQTLRPNAASIQELKQFSFISDSAV
ncbi:predicted protein [Nematostella vectensis]|uniref:Uncharacterized protein n=1 Tax=Nematostella vectensis TaxID=45351 RepID=A7TD27_NEMVE|nr:predicted protein [Nematostella vectensis]|eukprot:XP_001618129.1 hypothetical protein NEMVEDRAFT_v1g248895 [Nematostella vectensis]